MFFRFSEAHQFLGAALGFNTFVLYIFGLPAIAAVFLSGGLRRAFSFKCGWYWLGYLVWLVLAIPFSSWPGGAFWTVVSYVRTQWLTFFLIAGLVMTWKECWLMIEMLGVSGLVAVAGGKLFAMQTAGGTRAQISVGTYANANDFAALLILMCPFIALLALTPRRNPILRVIALLMLSYGCYLILATGSRGGLVAIVIAAIYTLTKLSMRVRLAAMLGFCVAAIVLVAVLPSVVRTRLTTLDANTDVGAAESTDVRREVLKMAVIETLTHPIFGVGAGQFGNYTGGKTHHAGGSDNPGLWFTTHNTYLQASAECGIPALILLLAALVATFRLLNRVYKGTRTLPPGKEAKRLRMSVFTMLVSMVAFCVAVFFLSFAYHFHLPAMTAIAMVLATAADEEFGIPVQRKLAPLRSVGS